MLDNEPDHTPEPSATESAARPPRRRRAASRPAGPPSSAPDAPPIAHVGDAVTAPAAPAQPVTAQPADIASASPRDTEPTAEVPAPGVPAEQPEVPTAQGVPDQDATEIAVAPAKKTAAKRPARKTAAKKVAESATDGEPVKRPARKRTTKKAAATEPPADVAQALEALATAVAGPSDEPSPAAAPEVVVPALDEMLFSEPVSTEATPAPEADLPLAEPGASDLTASPSHAGPGSTDLEPEADAETGGWGVIPAHDTEGEPHTDEPPTDETSTEETLTDEASTNEASTDESQSDEPRTDEPQVDEPRTDEVDEADDTDEDDDDSDETTAANDGEPRRRRRRRGGRRRRRGGDNDDTDANSDDSADADSADAESGETDSPRGPATAPTAVADAADAEASETGDAESDADGGDDDSDSADGEGDGSRRRRRRRRRRGEDAGTAADDPAVTEVVVRVREPRSRTPKTNNEVTGIDGSTRMEAKRQRRREGREAGRRRAPIMSEAEFLARRESVERKMIIRQRDDLSQIAVIEDDILVEHYVDRDSAASLIGNVYLGRVQNVLPSMEAAFIDIGRGRNAVIYAGEIDWDSFGAEGQGRKVEKVLKSGQPILVQVTKDPVGAKGARLTNHVSIPGRYIVYAPGGHLSGISRKLPDNERKRLKDILADLVGESASVIVRTAAEGASEEELVRDVNRLKATWEVIEKKVAAGQAPQLLYAEPDLTVRIVRDLFTEDFSELIIQGNGGVSDAYASVEAYVTHVAPHLADRLRGWDAETQGDLFGAFRLDEQIAKGLERKVFLPSGGSLVIDRTEAMTVIDVNTGKFTGAGGNLEATVTSNNLEAAEEIVRQLRLRDIGGIIVIDFIDMVLPNNRELLLRRLVECLGRDRTRHQVAEVTSLGLVQMTRKKIGTGLLEAFSAPCEHCHGRGYAVHDMPVETQKQADGGTRDGSRSQPNNRRGGGNNGGNNGGDNVGGGNNGGGQESGSGHRGGRGGNSGNGGGPQGGGANDTSGSGGNNAGGTSGGGTSGGGTSGGRTRGRRGGRQNDETPTPQQPRGHRSAPAEPVIAEAVADEPVVTEPSALDVPGEVVEREETAIQHAPDEAPVEQASVEQIPVDVVPAEPTPVWEAPLEQPAPVEQHAAEAAPVEHDAAESAPVEQQAPEPAPVDPAPSDHASSEPEAPETTPGAEASVDPAEEDQVEDETVHA